MALVSVKWFCRCGAKAETRGDYLPDGWTANVLDMGVCPMCSAQEEP